MSDGDRRIPSDGRDLLPLIDEEVELPSHIKLARDQHEYDPGVYADNSNIVFEARAHDKRQADRFLRDFFTDAARLRCPRCASESFRIFTDQGTDQPLILIVCYEQRCGATWAPMAIRKAQMTDAILKNAGVWLPGE